MRRGKCVEAHQRDAIAFQAVDRLGVFVAVTVAEMIERLLGRFLRFGQVDVVDQRLRPWLKCLRQLVQNVRGLVYPATLSFRGRKHLRQRLPEPQCAIGDRKLRIYGHPAILQLKKQLLPARFALSYAIGNSQQLFLSIELGPDDDENAAALAFHPRVEVHPVGPDVGVLRLAHPLLAPLVVLLLPRLLQPAYRGSREASGLLALDRPQRAVELVRADPFQVEYCDHALYTRCSPHPPRQHAAGESFVLGIFHDRLALVQPGSANLYRTDTGEDPSLRSILVAYDLPVSFLGEQIRRRSRCSSISASSARSGNLRAPSRAIRCNSSSILPNSGRPAGNGVDCSWGIPFG